jgi:arginyl-tRNA synthetase
LKWRKTEEEAKKQAPIILEAQEMLQNGKLEMKQWKRCGQNEQWVYDGFAITYKKLRVDFDKYYESNICLVRTL